MLVSLLTLGPPDQLTGGYLYHRRVADRAGAYGARVEFVPVGVTANPFRAASGDVVLVDSIAAARVAPWRDHLRRPLAAIAHQTPGGIDHGPARRATTAVLDLALYRRCAVVIAASDALAGELDLGDVDVLVVAPGCDGPPAPPAGDEAPDLRAGRRAAFVSVGNWMARKGTLELLDAFASLPDDRATLHLAGREDVEPRYMRKVRARLATAALAGRVVCHGPVSAAEVGRLYAGADAFVLPSYREPYGTVLGEALAAGLPIVGWRAGNLPHLIAGEPAGVAVEPGDVPALAAALDRIATDDEWRAELAAGARRRGEGLPTWDDTAARLFGVLTGLTTSAR